MLKNNEVLRKSVPITRDCGAHEEEFARFLRIISLPILVAALAVSVHASLELRGLYADGAGAVLEIIESQDFSLPEGSRRSAQVLMQWPTVLAVKLGISNVGVVMALYCLMAQILPLLILMLCYVILPKSRKEFFFFPLLHYLAGSMAASFVAIADAPVASAYFWMLLYLILFRANDLRMRVILVLTSLPVMWLHEVMSFLAPVLALASAWQARQQTTTGGRFVYWALTSWFLVIAIYQIGYIVDPVSVENRDGFISDFLKFVWLGTLGRTTNSNIPALNLPAFLGIVGIMAMLIISGGWPRANKQRNVPGSRLIVAAYGATCVFAVVAVATVDWVFVPNPQFAARHYPAIVSAPLALLVLASIVWASARSYWAQRLNVAILVCLAVATLGWHVAATQYWSGFIQTFRETLSSHHGLVAWEEVLEELPEKKSATLKKMAWSWTNPTLSFLLSPGGRVTTVIANPATAEHEPFDPADPSDLPRSRLFNTTIYRAVLQISPKGAE